MNHLSGLSIATLLRKLMGPAELLSLRSALDEGEPPLPVTQPKAPPNPYGENEPPKLGLRKPVYGEPLPTKVEVQLISKRIHEAFHREDIPLVLQAIMYRWNTLVEDIKLRELMIHAEPEPPKPPVAADAQKGVSWTTLEMDRNAMEKLISRGLGIPPRYLYSDDAVLPDYSPKDAEVTTSILTQLKEIPGPVLPPGEHLSRFTCPCCKRSPKDVDMTLYSDRYEIHRIRGVQDGKLKIGKLEESGDSGDPQTVHCSGCDTTYELPEWIYDLLVWND